jgi:hypothetical protein
MSSEIETREGLPMKERLNQLLGNCIEKGSEEDLRALVHILEGFEKIISSLNLLMVFFIWREK